MLCSPGALQKLVGVKSSTCTMFLGYSCIANEADFVISQQVTQQPSPLYSALKLSTTSGHVTTFQAEKYQEINLLSTQNLYRLFK